MQAGLKPTDEAIGTTQIGRTTYRVYRLPVLPNTARAGVVNEFALEGPRGAWFLVIDHGPRYKLNSIACGGGRGSLLAAPRPLAGLDRKHLAAFGVECR